MILFVLAYLGGVLTIVSPCILPVLPFVFARADRSALRSGLPMLIGMAATFAAVATLAAVAGGWAVEANQYGRDAALALLALFGLALLFPGVADRLARPFVAFGAHLSETAERGTADGEATVTIDGTAPGSSHGVDSDADGQGTVTAQRLYQLIRQDGKITDHTFEIEFLDPGVQAYAFTFG
jgi:hypothetical protein